jgi:hypothetical protein
VLSSPYYYGKLLWEIREDEGGYGVVQFDTDSWDS